MGIVEQIRFGPKFFSSLYLSLIDMASFCRVYICHWLKWRLFFRVYICHWLIWRLFVEFIFVIDWYGVFLSSLYLSLIDVASFFSSLYLSLIDMASFFRVYICHWLIWRLFFEFIFVIDWYGVFLSSLYLSLIDMASFFNLTSVIVYCISGKKCSSALLPRNIFRQAYE